MVSLPLSVYVCVCVCVFVRVGGWAGTCAGGVRFSNSNRIIHSDYRILLLLKMHIPNRCMYIFHKNILCLYIYIYYKLYEYKYMQIFSKYILYVFVFIYT